MEKEVRLHICFKKQISFKRKKNHLIIRKLKKKIIHSFQHKTHLTDGDGSISSSSHSETIQDLKTLNWKQKYSNDELLELQII